MAAALALLLASAAALRCAPVTTRRSTALNLAPRHVLEAEFARRATDGLMDLEAAKITKQIAAELAGGNIDNEELAELWGPGSRDVDGFVGVCRSIDDFFEKDGIEEVALTDEPEGATVGERLRRGEVVLRVENACTLDDCNFLYGKCTETFEKYRTFHGRPPTNGRGRFAVADSEAFDFDVVSNAEAVFLNVLDALDAKMPDIYDQLFAPGVDWVARQPTTGPRSNQMDRPRPDESLSQRCPTLRDLYMAGELEWSEGEPAMNLYEAPGLFGAHKDHMALTVLVPLTAPSAFAGGGTGFWGPASSSASADGSNPDGDAVVVTPSAGDALVFGGDVTHGGMLITAGRRSVLVASFSTRTPDSPPDRTYGLQPAPAEAAGSLRRNW
jgi:hypothetical protein